MNIDISNMEAMYPYDGKKNIDMFKKIDI